MPPPDVWVPVVTPITITSMSVDEVPLYDSTVPVRTVPVLNAITNVQISINTFNSTVNNSYSYFYPDATPTPEQASREKLRVARACGRARRLLRQWLTDAEHESLQANGFFEVTSLTTGRVYRVYRGYSRNVVRLNEAGVPTERLCAHGASSKMPVEDHMLAQKIYLETCEADFRKIANITKIYKVEAEQLLAGHLVPTHGVVDRLPNVLLPLAA